MTDSEFKIEVAISLRSIDRSMICLTIIAASAWFCWFFDVQNYL